VAEQVNLEVVKAEREAKARRYAKDELRKFVDELPDGVTGWIVCAIEQRSPDDVTTHTRGCGNSVVDRFAAQAIGVVRFTQYGVSKGDD
jgi:hypothetical protein